jgi:hypothetical protein
MRETYAAKHLGLEIVPDDDPDSLLCREDGYRGYPGVAVMAESGVITRIVIFKSSSLRTERGFGIGSREADVRRAYGAKLKVETRAYEDEAAHYLTFWATGGKHRRGVRYSTNAKGRVEEVFVGSNSIEYIEGCS